MGLGFTVMVALAVSEQPFESVAVTVYSVVEAGDALTVLPVVPDKPVDGVQL